MVLSGSQCILSPCLNCSLRKAGTPLCCSTMSMSCSLPLRGISRSSRPCLCCRTHAANFHSCRCSPPICRPARRNLIGATVPERTKAYVVFCHAELRITPFTRVSLFGQDEGVACWYQAKDQKRNRRKLHRHHFLRTDCSDPRSKVDKGDSVVWMTSQADVWGGTAAAFPPRR